MGKMNLQQFSYKQLLLPFHNNILLFIYPNNNIFPLSNSLQPLITAYAIYKRPVATTIHKLLVFHIIHHKRYRRILLTYTVLMCDQGDSGGSNVFECPSAK